MAHLSKIATKYGTDKAEHGYIPHYEKHLPQSCNALLEIGIAKGASALMWDEYYNKSCDIHYLDLFINPEFVNARWCRNRNFVPHEGSQSDLKVLARIHEQLDVIIDDGSHNAQDQFISFKHLFLNNLKSGGIYFIEDAHCNKEPFYWGGEIKSFEDTPLYFFDKFNDNPYFNEGELEVFKSLIKSVNIYDDKLIVIERC